MIETEIDLTELLHGSSLPPQATDRPDVVEAALILDCRCLLGEGILYDDRTHCLQFPDILAAKFHQVQLDYEQPAKVIHRVYDLPKKLCSFAMLEHPPVSSSSELAVLCAWEDGFQIYDIAKGQALSGMSVGEDVNPQKGLTRLNDGRVDPSGERYICGGYYGGTPGIKMKVFRVEQEHASGTLVHSPIVGNIEITNSICWSLDGKTMYLADSPTRQICAYDYEAGSIRNKVLFHAKNEREHGVPDGSVVDADGFLWNAVWKEGVAPGCVQRIDPSSGQVVFTVHMPDATSQVSCCCFGGKDLDILFITTACESLDPTHEPHAGGLYAAKVPFKGNKESRFKLLA